ncbi:MAG: ribosome biogenesis GTPase YlqF, partial [Cyanobacteriota bacterium]
GQDLDLLDAPGVLPPQLEDQGAALLLAICDDIGQAAYDTELVALAFLERLVAVSALSVSGAALGALETRYGVAWAPAAPDPDGWLAGAAARHASGDRLRMATRLLDDFRCGRLGVIGLEVPEGGA